MPTFVLTFIVGICTSCPGEDHKFEARRQRVTEVLFELGALHSTRKVILKGLLSSLGNATEFEMPRRALEAQDLKIDQAQLDLPATKRRKRN